MSILRRFGAWLWLLGALLVVGILTVISSASAGPGPPLGIGNPSSGGALALYLWLERAGYDVHFSTTLQSSHDRPGVDTLLLLDPQRELSRQQINGLFAFAQHGGRVVIGTDGAAWNSFSALGVPLALSPVNHVSVTEPLLLSPPAASLSGDTAIVAQNVLTAGTLARNGFGSVVIRRKLGRGEIWMITAPVLLDNSHLARDDNRRFALNLAGSPGSHLQFAELGPATSASSSGSSNWLTGTVWGVALIFSLLVGLLYRSLGGWRLGPPIVPFGERRRPAVEYVISLADLLRRARKRAEVLRIYQRMLRQTLVRRLGSDDPAVLPASLSVEVATLLEPPARLDEEDLLRQVTRILECEEAVRSRHV